MSGKRKHRFQIEAKALDDRGAGAVTDRSLSFEFECHDDIILIAGRLREATPFSDAHSDALAIGLKLFTAVMLAHSDWPPFEDVRPAMQSFIRNLKDRVASAAA